MKFSIIQLLALYFVLKPAVLAAQSGFENTEYVPLAVYNNSPPLDHAGLPLPLASARNSPSMPQQPTCLYVRQSSVPSVFVKEFGSYLDDASKPLYLPVKDFISYLDDKEKNSGYLSRFINLFISRNLGFFDQLMVDFFSIFNRYISFILKRIFYAAYYSILVYGVLIFFVNNRNTEISFNTTKVGRTLLPFVITSLFTYFNPNFITKAGESLVSFFILKPIEHVSFAIHVYKFEEWLSSGTESTDSLTVKDIICLIAVLTGEVYSVNYPAAAMIIFSKTVEAPDKFDQMLVMLAGIMGFFFVYFLFMTL